MPKTDFDIITLAHGSGGLLTGKLLDTGVFDLLKNDKLNKKHDGAIFSANGKIAVSTDSFVISPIFFPGGDIGELAVNGTVNDVAMCGAVPEYLSLSFIIEEGLKMTEFWDILVSIKYASEKAGIKIITGDTKVVDRGKGDKIFINTTGFGKMHPEADIDTKNIKPGDKIIISNNIATHGIAILSVRKGLEFETDIKSDTRNLNKLTEKLLDKYGKKIHLFRDPTRSGVAGILNEIAEETNLGIELSEKDLPIDPQVKAACEILGLDPLYSANEGIFVTFADTDIAEEITETLRQNKDAANAAIIGEVTKEHPQKVLISSGIGGKRVVQMPVGEQLPRIC
ncbi:MAG: hydrogenase expression/formation protein HypE [Chlorobi bacterium]|nr:hydrogenase expression/formation protein HypE [Chlorobiota bacterium]